MLQMPTSDVQELQFLRDRLQAAYADELRALNLFVDGAAVARVLDGTVDTNSTNNATRAAFLISYAIHGGLSSTDESTKKVSLIERSDIAKLAESINVANSVAPLNDSDVGKLPNGYDTTLQVAGVLSAVSDFGYAPSSIDWITQSLCYLCNAIKSTGGYIARLDNESVFNAYLTFWARFAVLQGLKVSSLLDPATVTLLKEAAHLSQQYCELACASQVGYFHAQHHSRFDPVELSYATWSMALSYDELSSENRELAAHVIKILVEELMMDGNLAPSKPVFADKRRNFAFQCTATEALAPGLWILPTLFEVNCSALTGLWNRLLTSRLSNGTWASEYEGEPTIGHLFATVSSLTVISRSAAIVDNALAAAAAKELGVRHFTYDAASTLIPVPSDFEERIMKSILNPLRSTNQDRDSAYYSLLLHGPPGTSKTSLARRLAQDLKWPILILDPGDFALDGEANMLSRIVHTFKLLLMLKNTVIVFDEFETMGQNRHAPASGQQVAPSAEWKSRLMTTILLPRLQQLRDAKRSVFVIITNDIEAIDPAIRRAGRIDIIRYVGRPDEAERKAILDREIEKWLSEPDMKRAAVSSVDDWATRTEGFCFQNLRGVVLQFRDEWDLRRGGVNKDEFKKQIDGVKAALKNETNSDNDIGTKYDR